MRVIDQSAVAVSRASRGGLAWAIAAALVAKRRGNAGILVRTMGAAWSADLLALGLSHVVGRERPCRTDRSLVECPDSPSFPSNHSATASAAAAVLADVIPGGGPLLATGALAVMASRVRVGVHHVGDVVGGAALGLAVARIFEPKT